jgi:hypothetical protein
MYAWWVGTMRDQILARLPPEVSAEQRARLEAAFEAFPDAVASGRLPFERMFEAVGEINQAFTGAQRGELTAADVERLVQALERAIEATAPRSGGIRAAAPAAPAWVLA